MNSTNTNQASEAELDKALGYMTMVWDESSVFGQPPDYSHVYLTGKQEVKEAIQGLIRTEKLKLLDEVIHQSTVNLKSAKAVAGWAELRKEQLEAEL